MPSLSDQKRFRRRERLSLAAANAARGQGWRTIHAETIRTCDKAAAGRSAEDVENQTRSLLAAWTHEGGAI
ncbi:hypothetical protein [Sphingomonas sp. MMS24-J13]|uniref:hypothetical protein n=1 Tax=Sphingomonas sp. MMS24-J13 TaxID=3238686 RepID=UPI00384AABB5